MNGSDPTVDDAELRRMELETYLGLASDHIVGEVMHATARAEIAEHQVRLGLRAAAPGTGGRAFLSRILTRIRRRGAASRTENRVSPESAPTPVGNVLLAFPLYAGNRWQEIMYSGLRADGWQVLPLDDLGHASLGGFGGGSVLHVNWTGAVTQRSPDLVAAASAARAAIGAIESFQDRGGRVVWTVHNVLPHELHHLGPEVALCRELASCADVITVMNPDTADLVADWYRLPPDKTRRIPHPSYLGLFPDGVDRSEARRGLGVGADEIALLFLGQLRPYKGLEDLVAAFRTIRARNPRIRLLVAGERGPGYSEEQLRTLLDLGEGAVVSLGRVVDEDMQRWCAAADLMVLPYHHSLNISLVSVAATFGVPVAVPDSLSQRHLQGSAWVKTLPSGAAGFADALEHAAGEVAGDESLRQLAREAGRSDAPDEIARRFRDLVTGL